ncbi:MAG: ferrous iron transport protein B [candidate division Zixibacteria bacterium]|nr:ferrous iron transport protein B [candidate division Zixibacteria bacterium]
MSPDQVTPATLSDGCATCPMHHAGNLIKLGVRMDRFDYVIALAGNPNTGKSTVFNSITGLRQHTGNWPGKTVTRAEGAFALGENRYKLVDLPGTYSLATSSLDEEIARNFILFGQPDVTVIIVDANHLERNLNLTLQILEITDRVVICLNLIDEAKNHGMTIDERSLSRRLGVPVISTIANSGEGIDRLLNTIANVATGKIVNRPRRSRKLNRKFKPAILQLVGEIRKEFPSLSNPEWIAIRLLDGDRKVEEALKSGELLELSSQISNTSKSAQLAANTSEVQKAGESTTITSAERIINSARKLELNIGVNFQDQLVEDRYAEAVSIAAASIIIDGKVSSFNLGRKIDNIVTSRWLGFPVMLGLLTTVFWLTIAGANVPSGMIATLLVDTIHPWLMSLGEQLNFPWWLSGFLFDGVYLATAWVIAVMLPPMAIFFPMFTMLEDSGYLARVSFNLDGMFKKAGAHGKQALTMSMGFGCNAAGVIATRIIESRRERLIAIITNNFALCNGRWPTQILIATIFIGALVPPYLAGLVSAAAVVAIAVLGVLLTFVVSWLLSKTLLRGEQSSFTLELPPFRRPRFWSTLYTSLIDRTLFVLWRAVLFAAPAGALIWLMGNIYVGGISLSEHTVSFLDSPGMLLGLNGIILLAYILAIPANEIVIPTLLMLTVTTVAGTTIAGEGAGVMFEPDSVNNIGEILRAGGWTLLTGVNLMLFSLIHNPCSTTIYTIWKETGSRRWTIVSAVLPLFMGFAVCYLVAQVWRIFVN